MSIVEGAGGIVFNQQGKVLVLGHRNGDWVFAKGHIEVGETKLAAALREIGEESGVEVQCPDPQITYISSYTNDKGISRQITWYLCYTDARTVNLREKTFPAGDFFSGKEALKKLTFPEDKALLEYMLTKHGAQHES